jgi:hypothetical protein
MLQKRVYAADELAAIQDEWHRCFLHRGYQTAIHAKTAQQTDIARDVPKSG